MAFDPNDPSTWPVPPIPSEPNWGQGAVATPESADFPVPPIPPNFPDPQSSGMNWGALGGLKGSLGDAAKTLGNQSQPTKQQINMAQAQHGSPISRASLSALVNMLQQRDQSYYPTGGQVGAQPIAIPRTLGLLGF
jgi:hypothetical protein